MISGKIWDKSAHVNFSKANLIAQALTVGITDCKRSNRAVHESEIIIMESGRFIK